MLRLGSHHLYRRGQRAGLVKLQHQREVLTRNQWPAQTRELHLQAAAGKIDTATDRQINPCYRRKLRRSGRARQLLEYGARGRRGAGALEPVTQPASIVHTQVHQRAVPAACRGPRIEYPKIGAGRGRTRNCGQQQAGSECAPNARPRAHTASVAVTPQLKLRKLQGRSGRIRLKLQAVANSGFGQQELRTVRIGLELVAQALDEHPQAAGIVDPIRTPDLTQQLLARDD